MSTSVRTKHTITMQAAESMIRAARDAADGLGKPMAIAVTDEAGHLIAFARMDGAPLLAVELAQDKAYTAISFGIPSHAWHDFIKDDAPLNTGIPSVRRLVVFGGGYPIMVDGEMVGGIGVSGGHYTDDMKVAEAGLAAL